MNLFTFAKQIPPLLTAKLWRAVIEFQLIQPNDRVAIGFSGGKDSIFLLFLLAALKEKFPFSFDLHALHIDNGFAPAEEGEHMRAELTRYCEEIGIPFTIHRLPMEEIWESKDGKSPCFVCARHRRGALARLAKDLGFNKLALAHHQDDAVESFVMSLFQSGQLRTFSPLSYMDRSDITVIRPLALMREQEIIQAVDQLPWVPLKNPCPYQGETERIHTREWLLSQESEFPGLFDKLSRAMRKDQVKDLWPPLPTRKELQVGFEEFWQKKTTKKDKEFSK